MRKVCILGGCGYIGQALTHYLHKKYEVSVVDRSFVGPSLKGVTYLVGDYTNLGIQAYDDFILLAGLSSVRACQDAGQSDTLYQNVTKFVSLLEQVKPVERVLYASSASVYGNVGGGPCEEFEPFEMPRNFYDQSKQMIDMIAELASVNCLGLRFGTVCGYSPRPRLELMINSMVRSAFQEGVIRVANKGSYRAILGMDDLCRGIEKILETPSALSGPYNMASFSLSIGAIARVVRLYLSQHGHPTELEVLPDSPTYSFALNTEKFEKAFDFRFKDTVNSITKSAMRNLEIKGA